MKILICGSNPLLVKLMEKELKSEIDDIRMAWTASSMLSQLASFTPDVLITEALLPHMNGFEFIHNARKQFPEMLIIVISSLRAEHLIELIYRLGADDFIFKPFDPGKLKGRLRKVMLGKETSLISNAIDYASKI